MTVKALKKVLELCESDTEVSFDWGDGAPDLIGVIEINSVRLEWRRSEYGEEFYRLVLE